MHSKLKFVCDICVVFIIKQLSNKPISALVMCQQQWWLVAGGGGSSSALLITKLQLMRWGGARARGGTSLHTLHFLHTCLSSVWLWYILTRWNSLSTYIFGCNIRKLWH